VFLSLTSIIFILDLLAVIAALALLVFRRWVVGAAVFGAMVLVNVILVVLFVFFWPM
jgi:hypothetical protein